jgi:hypothetical protein
MIIKRSSWHYKVWAWTYWMGFQNTDGKMVELITVCAYWRRVLVIAPLWCVTIGGIILGVTAVIVCGAGVLIHVFPATVSFVRHNYLWTLGLVLGVILVLLTARVCKSKKARVAARRMRELIKAKKQKICPLVEFVDGPANSLTSPG